MNNVKSQCNVASHLWQSGVFLTIT